MLMLVRDDDTAAAVEARQRANAAELAAIAAAPVRYLPAEFLRAVEGLFLQTAPARTSAAR